MGFPLLIWYILTAKAFDKVDHGILLHKVKDLGITGKLGQWFYHFLTNRKHFVRLPGGLSDDHPVISGVPQGTVLGPLLFIIMIADINKDVASSKLISFADDTRVYSQIADTEDCDSLQQDLNSVYRWASDNNMFCNAKTINYLPLSSSQASNESNIYINPSMDIIPQWHDLLMFLTLVLSCLKTAHLILKLPVYLEDAITWLAGYSEHSSLEINSPC